MKADALCRVGVTRDIRRPDGSLMYAFDALEQAGLGWELLAEQTKELGPEQVRGYDAVIVLSAKITAETLRGADRLVLIARLGAGYDRVDVDACTAAGVLLAITPDGIRRPMAASAMLFVLALAHRLIPKDRHIRSGSWDRFANVGVGLTGRTLGLLGLGNVGRDIVALAAPWETRIVAHDPYLAPADAPPGVELVGLEALLAESDFLIVACPLNGETHHLVNADRLALMKPSAFLVNIARGPIVDQQALTEALREGVIKGAALDVFEHEPVDPADPILSLDNVILAPHSIGFTDELFRGTGASAARAVLDVATGRVPRYVVNPEALEHPRLEGRLARA